MRKALPRQKSTPALASVQPKSKIITVSYLENAGAYYLGRFSATTAQFRTIMKRKITRSLHDNPSQNRDACLQMLESVVTKFTKLGYLNDLVYGTSLVRQLKERGYSSKKMLVTLQDKGFPSEMIEELLTSQNDEDDFLAALLWSKKKRLGAFATRTRENQYQKELAALARAGFSFEHAQAALKLPLAEAEDILGQRTARANY